MPQLAHDGDEGLLGLVAGVDALLIKGLDVAVVAPGDPRRDKQGGAQLGTGCSTQG